MNRSSPVAHGLVVGYALPVLVLLPALLWGALPTVLDQGRAHLLLPVLVPLMAPAFFVGVVAAYLYPDRQHTWRFGGGLFLGGSLAASTFLWFGAPQTDPLRRAVLIVFGGPILAGFWLFVGALLGMTVAYHRRERMHAREPRLAGEF